MLLVALTSFSCLIGIGVHDAECIDVQHNLSPFAGVIWDE